jgi:WG containing repeat
MKSFILILCVIATTSVIYAQSPRVETIGNRQLHTYNYWKGGDSVCYSIVGKNDTVQESHYKRNGKLTSMQWKKDSSKSFDTFGKLVMIAYGFGNNYYTVDSARVFYPDGQLRSFATDTNGVRTSKEYDKKGQITYKHTQKIAPLRIVSRHEDSKGVAISTSRMDSVLIDKEMVRFNYDTLFYANGQPAKTYARSTNNGTLGTNFYNEAGKLLRTLPPDSLDLTIFKDNVDCYYGLKNKRGDTVVKPRFDRIEQQNKDFYAAYTGENAILLDMKGAPMPSPVARLSKIMSMGQQNNLNGYRQSRDWNNRTEQLRNLLPTQRYYSFMEGKNYGVMTEKGALVMPPQYLAVQNNYVGDGLYFKFQEKIKDSLISQGYLDRQGKRILLPNKNVLHSNHQDYFIFITAVERFSRDRYYLEYQLKMGKDVKELGDLSDLNHEGLAKGDGTTLLPTKFMDIKPITNHNLFLCRLAKNENTNGMDYFRDGIFEPRTQRWLLDTTHFRIDNNLDNECAYFVIHDLKNKKYGIMDTAGIYILPIIYDSVGVANNLLGKFWVKKGKHYQIFDVTDSKTTLHTAKYDYLCPVNFSFYRFSDYETATYFLTRKKGKWGVIDVTDKVIKPFDSDYAAIDMTSTERFILAKNNQAAYFDQNSLPNETVIYASQFELTGKEKELTSFEVADNKERLFFVNDTMKVVIPPQYRLLLSPKSNYFLVEDAQKKQKIIYSATGRIADYPFTYEIIAAPATSKIIVVKDSLENTYGVVSTDGKMLVPCKNYGIAIGEAETSTYFVRKDTVVWAKDHDEDLNFRLMMAKCDTLNEEDSDWLLYNGDGKLMDAQPFRFPIAFRKSVGVGMKNNGFNLYKTDGSVVMPFVKNATKASKIGTYTEGSSDGFKSIHVDPKLGFYTLFKNQGMTPIGILTKPDGEILVESGRYDGFSNFYGKYAIVTAAGKVGLIDSFGREVIVPQDLRTYPNQFMDSLNLYNIELQKNTAPDFMYYQTWLQQPVDFTYYGKDLHPDSLGISKNLKANLWNLLLEKCLPQTIHTASDVVIERAFTKLSSYFCSGRMDGGHEHQATPRRIVANDTTIAFALQQKDSYQAENVHFYNFYRRNNRWEELKINDLLAIQGEKRQQINDLITQKVKALKDQQIDCSNVSAFITTVENRWLLTKEGIDFCFDSTGGGGEFVIVSFTWAELKPFLKLRIY